MEILPPILERNEKQKREEENLFTFSQEICHEIVKDKQAMEYVKMLDLQDKVTAYAHNYVREKEMARVRELEKERSRERSREKGWQREQGDDTGFEW